MAARYGDANLNGNDGGDEELRMQYPPEKRRSTRFYSNAQHNVVFKPFSRESLINIRRRRNQRDKKQSTVYLDPAKPQAEPDPCLASGQQLPPALVRQLPSELIGKPIEDIDPFYADQETFVIISRGKELSRFSATKALYILGAFHPIRRVVLFILVNSIFNLLVILTILTNCILMTFQGSDLVEKTEIIFTIVYTTEMGLKVLARGFIMDKFTYLRDPWNWLDFTVIIMAYLTIVIQDLGNLSVMRTFRVLRALKTVAIIPGMKTIVGAVIDSVKNLKDVVVLTLFSLSVFSLLGLQIYMGQLTQKCILNGPLGMTDNEWFMWCSNSSHWIPEPDDEIFGAYRLCGNATGAQSCPQDHTCIQGFGPNPDYGYTNFDTFGWALICSFRLMTQDFWEGLYMQVLKTAGSWHITFFIVSIFLGSIYLMNLILAIVAMSYNELQRRAEEEEEAAAEDEAAFLESCRVMEMQDQLSDYSNPTSGARSSYRPSVEIGLVGQSLLASLCQNGLLGQHVRDKLNQQVILPGIGQPTVRSHSLSINIENREQLKDDSPLNDYDGAIHDSFDARGTKSGLVSIEGLNRPGLATSMTELRRKSSVKIENSLSPTRGPALRHNTPATTSPIQQPRMLQYQSHHGGQLPYSPQRNKLSPHYVSSGILMSRPEHRSSSAIYKMGRRSPRSSTTSDRDLQVLKQHAALIRIVSENNPETSSSPDGNNLTKDSAQETFSFDSSDQTGTMDESESANSFSERRLFARRSLIDSSSMRGRHFDNERASLAECNSDKQFLNVNMQTKTRSDDHTEFGRHTNNNSVLNQARSFAPTSCNDLHSESVVCQQPASIHYSNLMLSSGKQRHESNEQSGLMIDGSELDYRMQSASSARTVISVPNSACSSRGTGSVARRLNLDKLQQNDLHHLSVENFQQFIHGGANCSQQQISPTSSDKNSIGKTYHASATKLTVCDTPPQQTVIEATAMPSPACSRRHIRHDSRGYIHPMTMARSSFARPRASVNVTGGQMLTSSGAAANTTTASAARRMSKDFVRRASDWSRLSMSNNVDLRRLIRLWSHTNPYNQGGGPRPSFGSVSNYSQAMANAYDSPAQSIRGSNRQAGNNSQSATNSHRPSSVGSAWQAYELISAMSRRQNRYGNSDPRYAIDDNMIDRVSVNMRDRCIAYCLSCLDILCIWECCGAWLKIQKLISMIVFDPFTELFIILCILINTLFMALDSDDADANMKSIFERGNYFFTATFAVEASMKIMALSPKFYFREGWNVFDSIIVGLSLLELGLEGVYGLSVLRSFRLLRVFKLAKSWPTLNLLISIMGKAVGDLGNLTFVLAIIVFIFAVMGMQLFGNKYVSQNFPSGELPRWNFTDFMHSFMIVFRILCAEWIEPMWDCLLVGGWPCIPFFLIAVTVGNLVVLNLFLALLLASFGASNLSSPQADNVDTKKLQEAIARFTRFGRWSKRQFVRFISWIARGILGKRFSSHGISGVNHRGSESHDRPIKSHIASMSRLERLKNIELRTEQLKSKIRRSPEHHYHLKQLAKSQLKESSQRESGFNYHYKNKYLGRGGRGSPSTSHGRMPVIPIIVNEPADNCDNHDGDQEEHNAISEKTSSPIAVCSPNLDEDSNHSSSSRYEVSMESPQQMINNQSPVSIKQPPAHQRHNTYPAGQPMQPILEDSKDRESNSSLSEQTNSSDRRANIGQNSKAPHTINDVDLAQEYEPLMVPSAEVAPNQPQSISESITQIQAIDDTNSPTSGADKARSSLYLKAPKRQEMEDDDEKTLQHIETYIEKCICIGIICLKWFLFRQYIRKIVEHKYFDQCILVLIVISSGTLALEDKHLNERPTLKKTLDVLDTIFTIIFSLEMVLKWLAFGMKRYFGNMWSWLDFVIALVSFINLMASIFGSGKIQALKTMRTLRAMRGLRPLRALQRFQGMRVVVNALIQAIPSIFNVLLVCLIFWLIFSIMGVQMFGGKFWRCLNPETKEVVSYDEAANRVECIERNLTWANPQINFDNVLNAYLALFQVATFKGWIDIMNSATDSRTRDDQPIREANIYMYFYFVFFVIFGSFFTLNLFIGVIIDNFNEQKKKTGGSLEIFMTDDQKKYYHAMKKMRSKRPVKAMTRPKMKLQAYMFDITTSKKFDMAIMIIIGLNMFVMALEHHGQSQEFSIILENLNLIFIAIFTLECLSKIFAMRHFYFREPWNIFDFIVVDLSILGVVMKEYVAKYFVSPTLLRVVRVVKVGRVLRLVKGAKGIRTLLFALAMSLPALFNICLLLFLVMFIYAIFGMSFFMNVRPRAGIDETFNFETFTSSIIVLFQMSTSAGWDLVLDPLMDEENDCQKPDPAQGIEGTCGNKEIAIFYLISYVIVTFLIIINMYIAVILENYSQATEDVQEGLTDDDYEMYYEIWQKFDPDGTQYLPFEKLSNFVDALEDPLRIPKPNEPALVIMDIIIYEGNQCYCVDILDALTKYFFARKGLVIQVNEHLQKVQSTLHETPFERISTTYMLKRQHYCAKLIQTCWRRWREKTKAHNDTRNQSISSRNSCGYPKK